ncbi:MAG TPA: DNA polymerase Y family protein [Chitinophagaceae bacterium]
MTKRFISIWFPYLSTDRYALRDPALHHTAFVLRAASHGRMLVTAANAIARSKGVYPGMALADARAFLPSLRAFDDQPGVNEKLLHRMAEWCIRFTPAAAVDLPDGIILDASGCAHLWGGEEAYLRGMLQRFSQKGFQAKMAMADTIGAAWAMARFGNQAIIRSGTHIEAIKPLPPAALRIDTATAERLHKLGLQQIADLLPMQRKALRRRFGPLIIQRINQAAGTEQEFMDPVIPAEPYQERLPCLEPVSRIEGIEIALQRLLASLCTRLSNEGKGLRAAVFRCYRIDGKMVETSIGTSSASANQSHLFRLFSLKLSALAPGPGIELFVLEAPKTEDYVAAQEPFWKGSATVKDQRIAELVDRIAGKTGKASIHRYLPDEHYWPERAVRKVSTLQEEPVTEWRLDRPRPLQVLPLPEPIDVTAPIPDYPPMLFRHRGKLHRVVRADGPERIEQEWWIQEGQHRDYYAVEDEQGCRYWLFRSGHYDAEKTYRWFIHGYFP